MRDIVSCMSQDEPLPDNEKKNSCPTTSAVCEDGTLIELVYDAPQRRTALAVFREDTWTLESSYDLASGDHLVPFSPSNNLIKNEVVLLPSEPREYGSQDQLLEEITAFIHRYLDVTPLFEKTASYYVLLTWIYDAFNELPYLRLRGDFGSGKTRALLTIGSLCYKAFFASGASTVSPLFHILDAFRGTLVIDEADFRFSDDKAEIVKVFNNGNVKGLPVLRTMQTQQREFNPRAFQVFGPKIVAARGSFDDRALESRFFTEEMGQRRLRNDIPINLPDTYKEEALTLRNKLLLYRFRTRNKAKADSNLVDPNLEPRLNQILVPLLSVIDSETIREELRAVASGYQQALIAERGSAPEADVLDVIRRLLDEGGTGTVSVGDVTSRLIEEHGSNYERPITHRWVGSILRNRLRLTTYKSHGVYVLPLSEKPKLDILWEKYGIAGSSTEAAPDLAGGHGDMGTSDRDGDLTESPPLSHISPPDEQHPIV